MSERTVDTERWPDDAEWRRSWILREQYRSARQPRLRYIFEAIERAKHTSLTEDIIIRSALTIEHIMPQKWQDAWKLPGMENFAAGEYDPELGTQIRARENAVNVLGNLTLMTQALNSTVSNGPFSVKMPAIKANAALALNRELDSFHEWDEAAIEQRGAALFEVATRIWASPDRPELPGVGAAGVANWASTANALPPDGTQCRFTYAGKMYHGVVADGGLKIDGIQGTQSSFSSASRAVSGTSRNGWNDWYLEQGETNWVLADQWRKGAD